MKSPDDDHAVVMLDATGRVIGWNRGAERIKGYSAREIIGTSFEVFYLREEVALGVPAAHLAEAAAAGHVEYQGWRLRRDGTRFWADVVLTASHDDRGRLKGFGKVTRDVTERRNAEQALRDSQEQLRLLVDSAHDYAIVMLDADGRVTSWNPGAERVTGYDAADVVGRPVHVLYTDEDVRAGLPARHLAEAAAVGRVEHQGWRPRADGAGFRAEVVLTAVADDSGRLRGYGEVTKDTTVRRGAELALRQALRDSEEQVRLLVASVRDYAIFMLDPTGRVVSWNAGAERIKGYPARDIVGRSFEVFYPPERVSDGEPARNLAAAAAAGHVDYQGWRVRQDGSRFWADVVLTAVVDEQGQLRGFGKVTRDGSMRRRQEDQLAHSAVHDPLTGLGNRALLLQTLDHALVRLQRHPGVLALLYLDLDRFKDVNDGLGHDVGDELLRHVAVLLRRTLRPQDTLARMGGDEFVVLCEDLTDHAAGEALARRVAGALKVEVLLGGLQIPLSASVGAVTSAGDRSSLDLLRDADAAMYEAKKQGRGRYSLLDDPTRAKLGDRLSLAVELRGVTDRDELRACYQPLVELHDGRVIGAEALLRWEHPQRGVLLPSAFLSVAEDNGVVVDLDAWMLRRACEDASQWGRQLCRPVEIWVNLSARSLADRGLPAAVTDALYRSGLDPPLLTLELTEGALMRDAAATAQMLRRLRGLGVQLAVDDFGTGYSSLTYLQQFPVHTLKVDRSFVERLDGTGEELTVSAAIVRGIVSLAAGLDLRTVAEGIETPAQLAAVLALGCDLGQGYFLGRPARPQDIVAAVPGGVMMPTVGPHAEISYSGPLAAARSR